MKKKILFHINSLGKGGAERVVSILTGCFSKDDYDVVVVTLWRAEEEYVLSERVKRVNLEDVWKGKSMGRLERAVRRFWDLRKILRKEKPDIVISFCNKANFRCAYAMLGMRTPLLTSVRNDPKTDYLPYKKSVKRMEKKASGCVFQTTDAKACFSEAFQKKSRVIWNPIDEKYLSVNRQRFETGEDNGQKLNYDIVTVGRLSEQKNHLLLLRAFKRVREQLPDLECQLKIYGEESEAGMKAKLLEYVKMQGMEDAVHFMGQCSSIEEEISNASLFVLSSDYEGMPNALIEAMVLGLPVISTDCPCGGPAELIENEVSGILIPVGDKEGLANAMIRVLQEEELAKRLGRNARMLAEKVSPQKIYEEWKSYVDELISS